MTVTFRGRGNGRPGIGILLVAVIAVLVVLGAVLLLRDREGADTSRDAAVPQPSVARTADPKTASPEPDMRWVDMQGVDLPVSRLAGPRVTADGRAADFARTPLGAVLAAVHISSRTGAEVGPAIYRPTIAKQLIGSDVQALRSITDADYERKRLANGVPAGQPLGRAYGELIGYRVEAFTNKEAVVRLLTRGPTVPGRPSTYDSRLTVQWVDDDWRLVAPPGGDWSRVVVPGPATAAGYTPLRKAR